MVGGPRPQINLDESDQAVLFNGQELVTPAATLFDAGVRDNDLLLVRARRAPARWAHLAAVGAVGVVLGG